MRGFICALLAAFTLAGCAQYAEVKPRRASLVGPPGPEPLATAENHLKQALRIRAQPLAALGECVGTLDLAWRELGHDPKDMAAQRDYNFALSRVFEIIKQAKITDWSKPLTVHSTSGDYTLIAKPDPRPEWNPALYEFTPADQFDVVGKYVNQRTTRDGIGAPIVAVERKPNEKARETFAPSRLFYSITALARFEGRRCILSGEDPLAKETVAIDGHTFPLAADFTVPLAVMLQETDPKKTEIMRVLNPEKYADTASIERLQPYDPNKTIVLVIHGLMDSQATWTPMINTLRGDPEIRKRYQFWFYSYPSGYPYPFSAAILRHQLDALTKLYPKRGKMVIIGHSMGGCIARLLVTDSGDQLWRKMFVRPPEQVPLSPRSREYLMEELIFKSRPKAGRVIFISTPLRGADMARGWFGWLVSNIIRPAKIAREASGEMLRLSRLPTGLKPLRRANSVDTLSPESRFVKALNTLPLKPGVPYNTIIGDRGRGDSPNSSDGVVPYWSSHLEGAESELIVPADHSAHQNPEAIAEVLRILKMPATK